MRDRVVESRDGIVHFAGGRGQRRRERDEGKGGEGEAGHGSILSKDEGGSKAVFIEAQRFRWGERRVDLLRLALSQIGRASCRERVCQYVYITVVAVAFTKTTLRTSHI